MIKPLITLIAFGLVACQSEATPGDQGGAVASQDAGPALDMALIAPDMALIAPDMALITPDATLIEPEGPGRIGIGGLSAPNQISEAMERAGLRWRVITPQYEHNGALDIEAQLEGLDCLLMPGGADIDPAMYGEAPHESVRLISEARAALDFALIQGALARGMPILGICLGAQELSVALGGGLVQDIPSEIDGALNHRARHEVRLASGSRLAGLYDAEVIEVVSNHHQAVEPGEGLGAGLSVSASSADGVVEAIEGVAPGAFLLGLQYHPEAELEESVHDGLWRGLAQACEAYRAAHPGRADFIEDQGACHSDLGAGRCIDVAVCAEEGGRASPGYCPGGVEIQCCVR
ncbi:gamma-glutamyl-gamma-aminobutyrate hydrolase family protein [Myxococcota bacterium]|nr:gamma-glutamyl-gamma-aminobutyrate hydrolase family protein [Myxococcota bacterium]